MKRISYILLVFLALTACRHEVSFEPRSINFDRDVCHVCKMGLTDPKYNVQAINSSGEIRWYDDLGCLAEDINSGDFDRWKGDTYKIWIGDAGTGKWIDAEKAYYRYGDRTPMGYGYGALATNAGDSLYDFKTTMKRIRENKTMRADFIKQKKMSIGNEGEMKCGGGMKCAPGKCGGGN